MPLDHTATAILFATIQTMPSSDFNKQVGHAHQNKNNGQCEKQTKQKPCGKKVCMCGKYTKHNGNFLDKKDEIL